MKQSIKVLPVAFFRSIEGYGALQAALRRIECSSREIADVMTLAMANLYDKEVLNCLHIRDWEHLTDEDGRALRNMLKMDETGVKPKYQSRNYDLLQYLSICLQYLDTSYARYVVEWCRDDI